MKKTLFLALASIMLLFVACNKEEETVDPTKALVSTSWTNRSDIYSGDSSEHYVTVMTFKFNTETAGVCNTQQLSEIWGQTNESNSSYDYTYTFDGTNGTISKGSTTFHFTLTDDTHFTLKETTQVFTKK